jgi:CubicO group peptidase (beta-lactamase class C family)
MCALLLAQRGAPDLDRPVAEYWPVFAAGGKDQVTTRQVLSHRAGLPAIDRALTH